MDISVDTLRHAVVTLITLILSIAVHEFGHAFVADRLGDRLPRMEGRVTLNPLAHADPIGTIALPAFLLLFGRGVMFGWGKPVRVNPPAFTRKISMGLGHLLVALAGPMMNLLFGVLISIVLTVLVKTNVLSLSDDVAQALVSAVLLNFVLMFFNLLPVPPLDGATVLREALPRPQQSFIDKLQPYGIFVLAAFFFIPGLSRIVTVPALFLAQNWLGLLLS